MGSPAGKHYLTEMELPHLSGEKVGVNVGPGVNDPSGEGSPNFESLDDKDETEFIPVPIDIHPLSKPLGEFEGFSSNCVGLGPTSLDEDVVVKLCNQCCLQ